MLLAAALWIPTTLFGQWETVSEDWYSLSIDGAKSGWSKLTVESNEDQFRSSMEQSMTLSRGGINIAIKVTTEFVETKDGKPVSVKTSQEAMGQVSVTTWMFKEKEIMTISEAGGAPITKVIPAPTKPWLTPQAVKRLFVEQMNEERIVITYSTMSPELGAKPVTVVMTKKGEELQEVYGENIMISLWDSENDVMPITSREKYRSDGLSVGSSMNAGFGNIETIITSKHEALSPLNEIPELMVTLFVEPNMPIPDDTSLRQVQLKVKTKDGSPLILPSIGAQNATRHEDGSVTLAINIDAMQAASKSDLVNPAYLAATAICDGSDVAVIAIAKEATDMLPANASEMQKALALRAKVYDFIDNKGYSTAFASASQTARDPKGDCSEHGVLLCGVLRASGIPSRAVTGLVYVPNFGAPKGVFGWHMWSQALIDGKWVDLDATLQTPYSVGHIATTTTSLSDEGLAADMSGIIATIGNIDVEVLNIGPPKTK